MNFFTFIWCSLYILTPSSKFWYFLRYFAAYLWLAPVCQTNLSLSVSWFISPNIARSLVIVFQICWHLERTSSQLNACLDLSSYRSILVSLLLLIISLINPPFKFTYFLGSSSILLVTLPTLPILPMLMIFIFYVRMISLVCPDWFPNPILTWSYQFIIYLQFKYIQSMWWPRTNTHYFLILIILQLGVCWVNQQIYHNHEELEKEINTLIKENDGILIKRNCSNDENIHIIEFQPRSVGNQTKQRYLFGVLVCNEHAREVFSAEVCLNVIKKLLKHRQILKQYLKLKIIYNANPISREKAINGDYCLRTNENGVDLNRNFVYRFAQNQNEGLSQSPGLNPLSETYSQCLNEETETHKNQSQVIKAFMSIHTGEFSIYTTNCNTHKTNLKEMGILYNLHDKICPYCKFRQTLKNGHGNSFEDMKCRKGFKYSNVFEVYGGYNAYLSQQQNCWVTFNPTSQPFYNLYLERATNMIVGYFEQISQKQMV